ncbi:Exonuclease SbcC, partial [hydrothermal vent metagenome]
MKPIKLSVQAFGPFVVKEEIDFSLLGTNPLFLINGPTGSGKSTILDAICFALYGKTTGNDRDGAQMRCDQADANTLTKVVFDFSLGKKHYRVSRSPVQLRAKAKGEGLTEHKGEANLWKIDEAGEVQLIVGKKLREVTDEIEVLTGLNVEQFRQVMVLPQGKFRELLLADSADREKIFSKLFQTNIYKRIEDSLKSRAGAISGDKKEHDNKIKGLLDGANLNTEDELEEQLKFQRAELAVAKNSKEAMSVDLQNALAQKKSVESLLNQYRELGEIKARIQSQELLKPEIDAKQQKLENAQNAQKITPVFEEWVRVSGDKTQLTKKIKVSEKNSVKLKAEYKKLSKCLDKSKAEAKEVDGLKQTVTELKRHEQKVTELEHARTHYKQAEVDYKASSEHVESQQKGLDETVKSKLLLEKNAADIQHKLSDLGARQVKLQQVKQQIAQLQKLDAKKTQHNALLKQQERYQGELDKLERVVEASGLFAKQQELAWHTTQVLILANELQSGEPCPVCGSREHPQPARPITDCLEEKALSKPIVTREALEQAREQLEKDRGIMQLASNKVSSATNQMGEIAKFIRELEKDLGAAASGALADIEQNYEILKSEVSTLEKSRNELERTHKKIVQCSTAIDKLGKTVKQVHEQVEADKIKCATYQVTVVNIEKELPEAHREKSVLLKLIQQSGDRIKNLEENFKKTQYAYDECKAESIKQEAHYQGLVSADENISLQLSSAQNKWQKTLEKSAFDTQAQYTAAMLIDEVQQAYRAEISAYNDELMHIKGQLEQQEKALKDTFKPDLQDINRLCEEKHQFYTAAETAWKDIDARVNQLKAVKKKLKIAHDTSAKLEEAYAIYGTLSDIANGRTGNNISLQRFVLGVLLDDVLM